MKTIALFFILTSLLPLNQDHRTAPDLELYDQIFEADKQLFEAFNHCDFEKLRIYFSEDLEFFHDTGGLTNYDQCIQSIEDLCSAGRQVRRELVLGSMKVYPIPDYGAIQEASHHFYATEIGETDEVLTGTFKFVHVWKQEADTWKLARVVSYAH